MRQLKILNSDFVVQFGVIDHTIGTTKEHNLHFTKIFYHGPTKQNLRFAAVLENDVMICIISNIFIFDWKWQPSKKRQTRSLKNFQLLGRRRSFMDGLTGAWSASP